MFQGSFNGVEEVLRAFQRSCFKEVLRVFLRSFKCVSKKFQGYLKKVSSVSEESFKGVSKKFQENFQGV